MIVTVEYYNFQKVYIKYLLLSNDKIAFETVLLINFKLKTIA